MITSANDGRNSAGERGGLKLIVVGALFLYALQSVQAAVFFLPSKTVTIDTKTYIISRVFDYRVLYPMFGIGLMSFDLIWPVMLRIEDARTGAVTTRQYEVENDVYYDYKFLSR